MKVVIIGTDFIYDSDGTIKPVEINTNIGVTLNKIEDNTNIFDSTDIKNFITSNGFTKITYLGDNIFVKKFLQTVSDELNIDFEEIVVVSSLVTIPFIEDSTDNLIIRTAYDSSALLDEEYCKNKVNFLNLIKDTEFGSQFAYMNTSGELVSTITNIKDNGIHPNFILKAKYPGYDKNLYPKLFKVSNQQQLDTILENVDTDHFLMEFHINESKFYQNSVTKLRKISLLYPPTLESIHIGSYTDLSVQRIADNNQYDSQTFELDSDLRYAYVTKDIGAIDLPKLMDDDFVVLADGTLKSGLDLQIGDILKTIVIPNFEEATIEDDDIKNYNINLDTFTNGVIYTENAVTKKNRVDAFVRICDINFTDGTDWSDTINSKYLVLNEGLVKFKPISKFEEGDVVLLVNTSDEENVVIEQKVVSSVMETTQKFSGWTITVANTHLFLTKTSGTIADSPSFAAIEHNNCSVECGKNQCMAPNGFSMYAMGPQWS
jgi:hypothetical protein